MKLSMTESRIRDSKGVVRDSQICTEHLDGLVPVVEDWHAKMFLLEIQYSMPVHFAQYL